MKLKTKTRTYTASDNKKRTFKAFFWPDMIELGKSFPYINEAIPGAHFLDFGAVADIDDSNRGYDSLMKIFEMMFSKKYCDKPLTRKQIENGDIITAIDVFNLVHIALDLAGMKKIDEKGDDEKK